MGSEPLLDPEQSWRLLQNQQRRTEYSVTEDDRLLYTIWGLAWCIGYLGLFLSSAPDQPSRPWAGGLFFALIAIAAVVTGIHSSARGTGLGGAVRQLNRRLNAVWPAAFGLMIVLVIASNHAGISGPGFAVMTLGLPALVVGIIYICFGAVFANHLQYRLGLWILLSTGIGALTGPYWMSLMLSLLTGSGFFIAALLAHRARQHASEPA